MWRPVGAPRRLTGKGSCPVAWKTGPVNLEIRTRWVSGWILGVQLAFKLVKIRRISGVSPREGEKLSLLLMASWLIHYLPAFIHFTSLFFKIQHGIGQIFSFQIYLKAEGEGYLFGIILFPCCSAFLNSLLREHFTNNGSLERARVRKASVSMLVL